VAGLVNAAGEALQGHGPEAIAGVVTAGLAVAGLGFAAKLVKNASRLVRYGNETESLASKEAGKLLPRPGHETQPKWIGLDGSIDPRTLGKAKNYTYKMTINMRQDVKDWLDKNAIIKPNEPGRWGIPADKLDEFNKLIESITVEKR
jgi:hypothetical protein